MNSLVGLNQLEKYREVTGIEPCLQGLERCMNEHLLLPSLSYGDG